MVEKVEASSRILSFYDSGSSPSALGLRKGVLTLPAADLLDILN
jgi:hypothetical protein